MPTTRSATIDRVRRRPKDRKAQITKVAAEAFSRRGYYGVGMDDIASQLGISATALYRHYANKYAMFRAAVLSLGQQLVDATDFIDELADDVAPQEVQRRLIKALVEVALTNRISGGLYRWEGRYLSDEDQATVMAQLRLVNRRVQQPLLALRPTLTSQQRWTLSAAALSVIGSVADHRAKMAVAQIRALLAELAEAVLSAELPASAGATDEPTVRPLSPAPLEAVGGYEAVLQQSLVLFDKQGYRETGMGEIAAAVGMPTSSIYRFFAGKQDILSAVFRRAADRVSGELSAVLPEAADPPDALQRLVSAYVSSSFANPELAHVYYAERANLGDADREMLRNVQRATVDSWVRLLTESRPDIDEARARFRVHAAMSLVIDLGRMLGYDDTARAQATVRRLMQVTLGLPTR